MHFKKIIYKLKQLKNLLTKFNFACNKKYILMRHGKISVVLHHKSL